MQDSKTMARIMKDQIQYIMIPSVKYAQGIGTYASYDIAAYDSFDRDIVAIALDVTSDRDRALRIIGKFNKYQLSPIHLEESVLDMLE